MDYATDYMILATPVTPLLAGFAFGYGGWRPAVCMLLLAVFGIPALFVIWGAIPGSGCADCLEFGLFFPYAWLFVVMISGGWIIIIATGLVGWAAGSLARASGVFDDPARL